MTELEDLAQMMKYQIREYILHLLHSDGLWIHLFHSLNMVCQILHFHGLNAMRLIILVSTSGQSLSSTLCLIYVPLYISNLAIFDYLITSRKK